jgi:Helicase HerA, central domain
MVSERVMSGSAVTPEAIDYLLRVGSDPLPLLSGAFTSAPPQARAVVEVRGRSARSKETAPEGKRAPAAELVTALATARSPFAFRLQANSAQLRIEYGLWAGASPRPDASLLVSVLSGAYLDPELELVEPSQPTAWPCAGFALGVPKAPEVDRGDLSNGTDRLIRAMEGQNWALLVVAEPVEAERIVDLRNYLINDQRAAAAEEAATRVASPLAQHYQELIKRRVQSLTDALSQGGWRVGTYLLGDHASFYALASVWRGLYSSIEQAADPVQVTFCNDASAWAARWALPEGPGAEAGGFYRHPFAAQTLMSSGELGAIVELPSREVPGFTVTASAEFDVVPPPAEEPAVDLGHVLFANRETTTNYRVAVQALTRHAFIAGTTGAGKTNSIFHLLAELARYEVPFLVLEPAKTEYRDLLSTPELGGSLAVFTVGDETIAPLRLNPFEPPLGTAIGTHIDLLRTAFEASFGLWTPLPQVLERCLHAIYEDYGWDLQTNSNDRLTSADSRGEAFPTLSDLVQKVEDVVPTLGYEDKVEGDIRAALLTRLQTLRAGSKGALLDTRRPLRAEELFGRPVVLELEPMGHEDDRALLMALMVVFLVEWRRTQQEQQTLRHLLVIEEAHRLLAPAGPQGGEESADPRGEAVRAFSNLLAEVRAYGQGVVIADQIPARLIPEVLKNTNLKIGHRIVAGDDQQMLARAMALTDAQARALATFRRGEAAVFSEGTDAAVRVQFPPARLNVSRVEREQVAAAAADRRDGGPSFGTEPFCVDTCVSPQVCMVARRVASEAAVRAVFGRLVLSLIEDPSSLDRLWGDFVQTVRSRQPGTLDEADVLRSVAAHAAVAYARRRGAQGQWRFDVVGDVSAQLRSVLDDVASGRAASDAAPRREECRASLQHLAARPFPPFAGCMDICRQNPPLCLYRHDVADLIASGTHAARWTKAAEDDATVEQGSPARWEAAQTAAYQLIEFPEADVPDESKPAIDAAASRVALCYAQQVIAAESAMTPRTVRREVTAMIAEATGG